MRSKMFVAFAMFGLSAIAGADAPPPAEPTGQREIADAVSADELKATITKLVGFGTRHTLSDTKSDKRGIGAARRWAQARFAAISKDCGGCLEIVTPSQTFTGKRVPNPT